MIPKAKCLSGSEGILNHPIWWDDSGLTDSKIATTPDHLPDSIETLIVGAGYTGLSAALTLARGGRQVLVVDSDGIGFGCSSRNGGQIGPSFHKLGMAGLTAAFGEKAAHAILHESMQSLAYLESLITDEEIECDLQIGTGRFKGANRAADYEGIARATEALGKAVGLEFEMIPKAQQQAEAGTDYYHGGVVYLNDGLLHPAKYVSGLAARAVTSGVRLIAPARVTGVQRDAAGFKVQVAGKIVDARQVLIATNGYSGPQLPFFHRRVMPIRSAIIASKPLAPEQMQSIFPKGRPVIDSSRLSLYYRPSPDGQRMVFGGRSFSLADCPEKYIPDLTRLMTRILPQLKGVEISHAWSGTVAYSFDHSPHIGCHEGLHYAMGYCGSGVGRASYYGHKIGLQMLGDKAGKTALDGLKFPTRPFYSGTPWFLPAVLRWHSMLDRFGR